MSTAAVQQPFEGANRDVDDYFGLHTLSGAEIAARRGVAFKTWIKVTIAAGATINLKCVGATHIVALRRRLTHAGGPIILQVIEGATITTETPVMLPAINLDRLSPTVSLAKFYSGITAYTSGSVIDYDYRPGTGTPGQGVGAESSVISYTRYDVHTPVIVSLTNTSGQAMDICYEFVWFEHEVAGL